MKSFFFTAGIAACFGLLFDFLFWYEPTGINIALFTVVLMPVVVWYHPGCLRNPRVWITGGGALLAAAMVILNHTVVDEFAWVASLGFFSCFVMAAELKSLAGAVITRYNSIKTFINEAADHVLGLFGQKNKVSQTVYLAKVSIVPVLVLLVFTLVFYAGNERFAGFLDSSFFWLLENTLWMEEYLVPARWILIGVVSVAVLFLFTRVSGNFIPGWEEKRQVFMERIRLPKLNFGLFGRTGLKQEFHAGFLLVMLLNGLLLVVNTIDIVQLWAGFEPQSASQHSAKVHEGTFLLIGSIAVSILIMLYLFRGNLNFLPNNQKLRAGCYAWIFQNGLLSISVFLDNLHYIDHSGLTHKRIGVLVFLLLAVLGLITLFFKISQVRTFYWIFSLNAWAGYAMLVGLSLVDWDPLIARHNLSAYEADSVDKKYLLHLNNHTLQLLDEHRGILQSFYLTEGREIKKSGAEILDERIDGFLHQQSLHNWKSWNLPDHQTLDYFLKNPRWKARYDYWLQQVAPGV